MIKFFIIFLILNILYINLSFSNSVTYKSAKVFQINDDCSMNIVYGELFSNTFDFTYIQIKLRYIKITDYKRAYSIIKDLLNNDGKKPIITITKILQKDDDIYCCVIYNNIDISNYLINKNVAIMEY